MLRRQGIGSEENWRPWAAFEVMLVVVMRFADDEENDDDDMPEGVVRRCHWRSGVGDD